MCPPRPRHVSCQPWPGSSCSRLSVRLLCCQFWVFWISPCHTGFPDQPVNVTVQATCFSKLQNQPDVVQISNTLSAARGGDLRPSPRLRPCWWTWALGSARVAAGLGVPTRPAAFSPLLIWEANMETWLARGFLGDPGLSRATSEGRAGLQSPRHSARGLGLGRAAGQERGGGRPHSLRCSLLKQLGGCGGSRLKTSRGIQKSLFPFFPNPRGDTLLPHAEDASFARAQ